MVARDPSLVADSRADATARALAALQVIAQHPEWPIRSAIGVAEAAILDIHSLVTGDNVTPRSALIGEIERLHALLNTPEVDEFDKAIPLEAVHQIERWGNEHDAGKNPEEWFWLVGYLAGKALAAHKAGDERRAKHHTISTAAALRNWHAHIRSGQTTMRPGIEPPTEK